MSDETTWRGYRASEKPRCPRCGGFLPEEQGLQERYVCPNCGPVRLWRNSQ